MVMRSLMIVAVLAACGGKQQPSGGAGGGGAEPVAVTKDTRTELEKRRDTACDSLGPKITRCAVDDARADLAAGKTTQKTFDQDTAPAVQKKNTEKFLEQCKVQMSSRQVRVLEVCLKEEAECGPLLDCLGHLSDGAK
jgi:hypothetical protein